jgi:dTMP kinase
LSIPITERGPARFITLEGGEGTGKSTQIRHLVSALEEVGVSALATREPGGSLGAEYIRKLILDPERPDLSALSETLLFYAARNDHLDRLIRPSLARGIWVVCDRFSDSTRAYQGALGLVSDAQLAVMEKLVVGQTVPDLTLVLDLPAKIGIERAHQRRGDGKSDVFERQSLEFHERLRDAFLGFAKAAPGRFAVINANGDEESVRQRIWAVVAERLLGGATHG